MISLLSNSYNLKKFHDRHHINAYRGFVRTGSTGSVEPVKLKIRGLEPMDFVMLHSRLWYWNPWIFRVY